MCSLEQGNALYYSRVQVYENGQFVNSIPLTQKNYVTIAWILAAMMQSSKFTTLPWNWMEFTFARQVKATRNENSCTVIFWLSAA